jgi:transporter family protein
MWWIYALLSALFAAITAIFVKMGVKKMDADLGTAIRTIVILIITWGIVFAKGSSKTINTLSYQNWLFLVLSGIATGMSWLFYFRAIQIGNVSQVAPIDKLSIVLVLIFSVVFLGETMTPQIAIGALLIILGVIVIIV